MRRLSLVATVVAVALALVAPASASYSDGEAVKFPAYHRVQQGESMWGIARDFLVRVNGRTPDDLVVDNEVRQMRRLNRDTLHGSDQIYPGQKLLLAPSSWDVPDGKDGWGTGFTSCTNERPGDAPSSAPRPGLTLRVRLLKPPADKRFEPVRLVMHNNSDQTRRFSTQLEHGLLLPADGSPAAVVRYDFIAVGEWTIPSGDSRHVDGKVATFVCGDTQYLNRRLGSGRYRLYGIAFWGVTNHGHREWVSPPRDVRVVRG